MPLIKSGLLIAFLFSFAISLGEFGATYYLARGEWTTLSLAIERLFASRNTLLPNLYASLLVIFSLLIFWVIEKFGSVDLRL
jgi:thiamine transport system permease protein|tara:strand:- start:7278 stop:7523 length:246 start_codon:yes stop_codon:yes gene_type:complete